MPSFARRLYRSLRDRGLGATLRSARRLATITLSRLTDRHFDLAFGTETRGIVENVDLRDVESPNLARGVRYEPTRALPFRRLMRAAGIPSDGTFVDLGCGKGRVLILAALCGFTRVVGFDYSPELCRAAERNLAIFRARSRCPLQSSLTSMDAADFAFPRDATVIYLYNPFDALVLRAVLARLEASLALHPRSLWIIYHNPAWRSVIEESARFERTGDYTFGGCEFTVYLSRSAPGAAATANPT